MFGVKVFGLQGPVFRFSCNRCGVVGLSFHMRIGFMILGFQVFVCIFQALWFLTLTF